MRQKILPKKEPDRNEELPYKCHQCFERRYKLKGSLMRHLKFECQKQAQFFCNYQGCKFSSKHKTSLKAHMIHIHNIVYN
ncbi:unnamed protein product [Callosobruchus maculatus]|uniref:C2H2-type domain-containing protein n=1 Tax=Callosobruchus maculatus TaxID=64391 RepID=A0A653DL32_CALMS|nr:unnamed protein product [Callosobruchus maculatus]